MKLNNSDLFFFLGMVQRLIAEGEAGDDTAMPYLKIQLRLAREQAQVNAVKENKVYIEELDMVCEHPTLIKKDGKHFCPLCRAYGKA